MILTNTYGKYFFTVDSDSQFYRLTVDLTEEEKATERSRAKFNRGHLWERLPHGPPITTPLTMHA